MSRHKWAYVHKQGGNRAGQRYRHHAHATTTARTARVAQGSSPPPAPREPHDHNPRTHARARPRRNHATTRNTPPTAPVQTTRQPHDRATTRPRSQPRHAPRTGARGPVASIAPSVPAGLGHEPACVHGHGTHGLGSSPPHSPMLHRHCIGMGMGTAHHSHTHERGHAALLLSPAMPLFERGPGREDQAPPPGVRARRERPRPPPQRVPITRARKRNPVSSRPPFRGADRVPPGGMP
jgi:hypothetical protein